MAIQTKLCTPASDIMSPVRVTANVKQSFTGKVIFYNSNSQHQVWERQTMDHKCKLSTSCLKLPTFHCSIEWQVPTLAPYLASRFGHGLTSFSAICGPTRRGQTCLQKPVTVLNTWMNHQFIFNLSIFHMFEILDILDSYHHLNNTFSAITKFGFMDFGISHQFCRLRFAAEDRGSAGRWLPTKNAASACHGLGFMQNSSGFFHEMSATLPFDTSDICLKSCSYAWR